MVFSEKKEMEKENRFTLSTERQKRLRLRWMKRTTSLERRTVYC